jgi:hypothetical protein
LTEREPVFDRQVLTLDIAQVSSSMALAAESMARVTRVTPLILVADVRDQSFRTLQLDLECGDQCILRIYNDVARLSLQLKTDGKLQLWSSLSSLSP